MKKRDAKKLKVGQAVVLLLKSAGAGLVSKPGIVVKEPIAPKNGCVMIRVEHQNGTLLVCHLDIANYPPKKNAAELRVEWGQQESVPCYYIPVGWKEEPGYGDRQFPACDHSRAKIEREERQHVDRHYTRVNGKWKRKVYRGEASETVRVKCPGCGLDTTYHGQWRMPEWLKKTLKQIDEQYSRKTEDCEKGAPVDEGKKKER